MAAMFQVCVISSDLAKRQVDLNTPDKLAVELHNFVNCHLSTESSRLLTVTECNLTVFTKLDSKLKEFDGFGANCGSWDFNGSFWSGYRKTTWNSLCQNDKQDVIYSYKEPQWSLLRQDGDEIIIHSSEGKYCAVILENRNNKRVLYTSVHLPSKNGETARYLLLEFIKNDAVKKYKVDGLIVAGDFNMKPSELEELFGSEFNFAIDDDNTKTTTSSSVDNVMTSKSLLIDSVKIFDDYAKLSHYPLCVNITSAEEDYF